MYHSKIAVSLAMVAIASGSLMSSQDEEQPREIEKSRQLFETEQEDEYYEHLKIIQLSDDWYSSTSSTASAGHTR